MKNKIKVLSYTDRKRLRLNFGEYEERLRIPHFYYMQLKSYYDFINKNRKKSSFLECLLQKIFPIYGNNENIYLSYLGYTLGTCVFTPLECKVRGLNYSAPLKIKVYLHNGNKKKIKKNNDEKDPGLHDIYLLDMPLMTDRGTFVINGTERVIVSQVHKAPGLYFEIDKSRTVSANKPFYVAKIIPQKGSWIDFEFDSKNCIFVRVDKKKKIFVTTFLRALDMDDQDILNAFFKKQEVFLDGTYAKVHVEKFEKIDDDKFKDDKDSKKIKNIKNRYTSIPMENLIGNLVAIDIISEKNNKVIIKAGAQITEEIIDFFKKKKIKKIYIIQVNSKNYNTYFANTLAADEFKNKTDALIEVHRILKPGEPSTKEAAKYAINNIFFNDERYDLSEIGRIKLNEKLKLNIATKTLSKDDIIYTIKKLLDIKDDKDHVDDIDHLGNRRVKSIGEILENLFRISFSRMEKSIREKLSATDNQNIRPQDIINTKLIATSVREFFCSSQLSQFMDQTNPLSEITHKRRLSALGPGGLSRERAGFEVRDVHNTHYGRICPIETPEGPNIGLINSLTIYARTNKYGFLETPYIIVKNKKITNEIRYLTANDENETIIAQANARINKYNEFQDEQVSCRFKSEFIIADVNKIEYIDISPKQIVSISTALIPFLEHNDANRALMGSNMQRQATPLLMAEKPLVGTGMEKIIAMDSAITVSARRNGIVKSVDAARIIVKVDDCDDNDAGIDIYKLIKYIRSNQNTCINQKPLVTIGERVFKSDIIADGPATDLGELALGQNLLVAFMPWNGYNFEDSIILSENMIKKNKLTSVHIEELVCMVRDSKIGPEEITSDIPNISDASLKNLDEFGIVKIGTYVKQGDILVGKITKKSDSQISPEEKLLHAIFGEKALNIENTSLKVPAGVKGAVIDIQIFNRYGMEKDKKTLELEDIKFQNEKKNYQDELYILKNELIEQIVILLSEYNKLYSVNLSVDTILKLDLDKYKSIVMTNSRIKWKIYIKKMEIEKLQKRYVKKIKKLEEKYKEGDDLPPGVIKMVKIAVAMKKKIQIGDKLSGRHGNKGVVSIIAPVEDMPYLSTGETIDVILNPLGVPSRMNIGQVLETHLGWAAKNLGTKISKLMMNFDKNFNTIKRFISSVYNIKRQTINVNLMSKDELKEFALQLIDGVPIATPVFDGIKEKEIKILLKLAGLPDSGKTILYDGKSGLPFDNTITVGYQYLMKLNHLIDDKMHARATGSYSLISQQPLGGKAQFGGQRFGEMEVWALEAYGAAYTLQEMLTVKSDDITGRTKIYKNIIDNKLVMDPGIPEAFNVLSKEILSLGLNIELEYDEV